MKPQLRTFLILLACSLLYFLLFIPANRTGAQNPNMLAVFEVDEYAQYPYAIHMLTPGATVYESLRNFLIYVHYFYGYPFYFFSALALLPLKLILGANWIAATPVIVATLRQAISVLPMLAAVLLLVYMHTRFRSWWRALGLFALLLAVPAVVLNNLWWHVDSLVFLFIALTLFFLERDNFRYGRSFLLAAFACGLAAGTKQLGVFFVLAIPLYLAWGMVSRRVTLIHALAMGAAFIGAMALAVVVSNPLLLVPQYRGEIIHFLQLQYSQTSSGIILTTSAPYFLWGQYPTDFRVHYGELAFVLLGLAALGYGILHLPGERRSKESRDLPAQETEPILSTHHLRSLLTPVVDPLLASMRLRSVLILAWIIPMFAVITGFATRRTHYFIPVMLPLLSCLANLFPQDAPLFPKALIGLKRAAPIIIGLAIAAQFALFIRTDVAIYTAQLNRERNSASLQFSQKVTAWIQANLPSRPLVIYRDWHIYLPEPPGWNVEMNWDLPNPDYIQQLHPDLIVLESENIAQYARPDVISQAANPGNMQGIHAFYAAAAQDAIPGYHKVLQEPFGVLYARNP